MRRHLPLAVALLLVTACGGDDEAAAPCDLLPLATAEGLVDQELERIRVADGLSEDADEDARTGADAADLRSCIYAPAGTEIGSEPATAVALQLDRGLYDSKEELLAASQVGGILEGVGRAAIIETEEGGFTVAVIVDDELSFGLVVRDPGIERESVIDLAREIADELE
ncbi:MAG TPA: hypothetical protein VFU93_13465 [Acidimicrobiales bacterium]|nr:hypothetical protein [Acidimicrobiales bacterium]